MKTHTRSIYIVLAVLAMLALAVVPVAAGSTKTPYEGTQTITDFDQWEPGTWTYPGNNVHVRGMFQVADINATDPRVCGKAYTTINANWDADFSGPMWGTNRLEVDVEGDGVVDGVWEGNWTGYNGADGEESFIQNSEMHGVSGLVQGLKVKASIVFPANGDPAQINGVIHETGG